MANPFRPSREDGRSDRQVIIDLVSGAEPDETFSYETLLEALAPGLPDGHIVDRRRVYRAIAHANKTLLVEERRYLQVVKNVGYRVLRADEHLPAAIDRKQSAA